MFGYFFVNLGDFLLIIRGVSFVTVSRSSATGFCRVFR